MFKKIINFIKYSNVFTIVALIAFVAIASAVASNDSIKKNIIGEEVVETQGVDNTLLLAEDLDNFDLEMKIIGVAEDSESSDDLKSINLGNYYVDYQYKTLAIQDDVWQAVLKEKHLVVSKEELQGEDLGLHVSEELGEIIDYEISFLKEVQENEKEKGQTLVQETTKYTGLIGLVLDTKTKELPGYEPVVKPSAVEVNNNLQDSSTQSMEPTGDYDDFTSVPEESNYPSNSDYQWLINNCLSSNGYWYNDTCNPEEEVVEDITIEDSESKKDSESEETEINNISEPDDTFTCDADHPTICDAQEICEDTSLYWYNEQCNIEETLVSATE